ncbi:hypothetical protein K435DRAFT_852896 [Dendrothele bispora CBS 962.96]|uniref:Uncharacterized protein n=1 Tax=Dendrothele bispora (strain CBS 962.96) TaxID=1314807 RepID=A0A4S8MIU7_DENBC|nr:hypothetical protein K435DRAFT_852896 [Dendrothele bispora CBS 962.96]
MESLSRSDEYGLRDFLMTGLWQGVLWYTLKTYDLSIPAALLIAAKLFVEYALNPDPLKAVATLFGVVLAAVGTDFLSSIFAQPPERRKRSHSTSNGHPHQSRTRSSRHAERSAYSSSRRRPPRRTVSDITSVDSNSDLIGPQGSMSPLEREIAALRARASLADSERRRFKEEKKWAVAQGNKELASQMSWQVKRYSALMKSFHREADTKLLEASRPRLQTVIEESVPVASSSNEPRSRPTRTEGTVKYDHPTVSVDVEPSQIKSAIRVNVR